MRVKQLTDAARKLVDVCLAITRKRELRKCFETLAELDRPLHYTEHFPDWKSDYEP